VEGIEMEMDPIRVVELLGPSISPPKSIERAVDREIKKVLEVA
jgi:hypothetical protein